MQGNACYSVFTEMLTGSDIKSGKRRGFYVHRSLKNSTDTLNISSFSQTRNLSNK